MNPGEIISIKYASLFSVKLLHHYFLDKRTKLFDNESEDSKLKLLAEYDVQKIFEIEPTAKTYALLDGKRMVFKPHKLGFTIIADGDPSLPIEKDKQLGEGEELMFTIKVIDPYFYQYTPGFNEKKTVRIQKASVLGEQDSYYKALVVLDNSTSTRFPFLTIGPIEYDNLSSYEMESLVRLTDNDGNIEFFQANTSVGINDSPGSANWQKFSAREFPEYNNNKIYSEGDVVTHNTKHYEAIKSVPINQVPDEPSSEYWSITKQLNVYYASNYDWKESKLDGDVPGDAFGLIVIKGGEDLGRYSLYSNDRMRSPKFEIRFCNRWSWWHYFNALGENSSIPDGFFPLTHHGKAADRDIFPNPNGKSPLRRFPADLTQPPTKLFNDIFL